MWGEGSGALDALPAKGSGRPLRLALAGLKAQALPSQWPAARVGFSSWLPNFRFLKKTPAEALKSSGKCPPPQASPEVLGSLQHLQP